MLIMANGNAGTVISASVESVSVKMDDKDEVQVVTPVRSVKTQNFKTADGQTIRCVSHYIPIRLCFASTIHQSQGSSIPGELDMNPEGWTKSAEGATWRPAPGIAYTAASRAVDIKNVKFLKKPTPSMFVCDPKVKSYHKTIFG